MAPAHYTAWRAPGAIAIDGRLDKPVWRLAPPSTPFVDIVSGAAAWFDTRVRILWDDDCLYFGFTAEETDVRATLTRRDSKIWYDNDLEIFIAGENAYYEFEINAFNTIYEVFWIWKDMYYPGSPYDVPEWNPEGANLMIIDGIGGHVHPRGVRYGFLDWDFPGVLHAVHIDGERNRLTGADRGWSAEIAFPWRGLAWLADGRAVPPRDGDVWRIDCSRFQHVGPRGESLDPAAGWSWNRHGYYDSHMPETFPYIQFRDAAPPALRG
jgi:cellulose/xylan binding protein with CBM9 domain